MHSGDPERDDLLLLEDVSIFVGDGAVIERGHLVVSNGEIAVVGRTARYPADDFAGRRESLLGHWVLPGLIDAHCHLCYEFGARERAADDPAIAGAAAANAAAKLAAGVTTVRDLGGMRQQNLVLEREIEAGRVLGPRMVSAGDIICRPGGHMHHYAREASGPDGVREAALAQIDAGARVIKLMASGGIAVDGEDPSAVELQANEIEAAVEVAQRAGVRVAAHAHPAAAIEAAATAGCDSIEHGTELTDTVRSKLAEGGTAVIPTLCVYRRMAQRVDEAGPHLAALAAELWERKLPLLRRAVSEGLRIGVGTDSGTNFPAGDLVTELELLGHVGMGPEEALLSATAGNATILGLSGALGTIAERKLADLVVVSRSPLEDLSVLRAPTAVIARGRWLQANTAVTVGRD